MDESWDTDLVGKIRVDGNDVHVTLAGEIDAASSATLQARLDGLIESTNGRVTLDMSGISFMDSSGIRALVGTHQRMSAHGRLLILRNVSAATMRVLDLTGLAETLNIDPAT
jgi:anti-anti-sigma factor